MNFIEGYGIGLGMIVFIGPVFFFLLSSTLQGGLAAGLWVALGIILSDVVFVLLCSYGLHSFMSNPLHQQWISLLGGGLLMGFGLKYLLSTHEPEGTSSLPSPQHHAWYFVKGFLINFVNPFVLMVWIGLVNYGQQKHADDRFLFIGGILLGIFTLDVGKVFLAKRIQSFINSPALRWTYRIVGIILIGFGIRMSCLFFFN
jgi:threonine/homoserine/homoserine lactone efflux protein